MNNPFTLTFGKYPEKFVPRASVTDTILKSFSQENPPCQTYIITGVRGSGKTVMLTALTNYFRQSKDWIVADLEPSDDLLYSLAAQMYNESSFTEIFRRSKINLTYSGVGVEMQGQEPFFDVKTSIFQMLEKFAQRNKKILISIDEVVINENVKKLLGTFQTMLKRNYPVYILMTGLPENIDIIQNTDVLTFLLRAPKLYLSPLDLFRVADIYKKIQGINENQAYEMAAMTKGYPYAFQLLGYFTVEYNGDYFSAANECKYYLSEYVYEKIWSELSSTYRKILYAAANSETGAVKEIREAVDDMQPNKFAMYRDRLLRGRIISGNDYGKIKFVLPFFAEFVVNKYKMTEL